MNHATLLIYNPTAGPWDMTRALKRLATYLGQRGWPTEIVETHQAGDATRYARQAVADGVHAVLVAGGDGTINEVVNGLAGSPVTLGLVPVGTGNILAHQLQMPVLNLGAAFYIKDVGDALVQGRVQRVDLGIANARYFACWAGLGLDAEITVQMEPRPRFAKRLHALPYILAAFVVAAEFRGVRSSIVIGEHTFRTRALMVLASNIRLYASFFNVAPRACMDDGLLDIFVFKGLGVSYILRHLMSFFGGRHLRDPKVLYALARTLRVETSPDVALHLDGDPFGTTPTAISLEPGFLRLLVPPQAPDSLFSNPPEHE